MGRASVALGASDGSSGIMDGSVITAHVVNERSGRGAPFGVDRVGQSLSRAEASKPSPQWYQTYEAEREVAPGELWFRLSLDERSQFGCCFSRMLLKCLNDVDHEEQEARR